MGLIGDVLQDIALVLLEVPLDDVLDELVRGDGARLLVHLLAHQREQQSEAGGGLAGELYFEVANRVL
jgi:hypothetical protein